jgi:hypothetical protein
MISVQRSADSGQKKQLRFVFLNAKRCALIAERRGEK